MDIPPQGPAAGPALTLLERREIEAKVAGPIILGFIAEIGEPRALEIVRGVVARLAREGGAALARQVGEASLSAFGRDVERWREGGALEIEFLECSDDRLDFNVTRCRYAEMYRALGLADLGGSLSCQRDFALVEGFNPKIELTRTQTLMEGATHCDFRFRKPRTDGSPSEQAVDLERHDGPQNSVDRHDR